MKINLWLIIAVVILVAAPIWAYTSVRSHSYSGSDLSFEVGGGSVVVTNLGDEAIPVEMRAEGRTASFRIASAELDLSMSSTRQGSGRSTAHLASFELPVGQAKIDVTRGSDVIFVNSSDTPIKAVVSPKDASGVRTTVAIAVIAMLGAAYYISNTFQHKWVGPFRDRLPISALQRKQSSA